MSDPIQIEVLTLRAAKHPVDLTRAKEAVSGLIQPIISKLRPRSQGLEPKAIDEIVSIFVGGKGERMAKAPVHKDIRATLHSIISVSSQTQTPIPVLIPSSACKLPMHGYELDLAEVMMLRYLANLQQRVTRIYPLGLDIVVRLEDLTLLAIFPQLPDIASKVSAYTTQLKALVNRFNMQHFLRIRAESELVDPSLFAKHASDAAPIVHRYLNICEQLNQTKECKIDQASVNNSSPRADSSVSPSSLPSLSPPSTPPLSPIGRDSNPTIATDQQMELSTDLPRLEFIKQEAEQALSALGWVGGISPVAVDYLTNRYRKLYTNLSPSERTNLISLYYGAVIARKRLGGTGADPRWNFGRIDLCIAPPGPDQPPKSRVCQYFYPGSREPFWRVLGLITLNSSGNISAASQAPASPVARVSMVRSNSKQLASAHAVSVPIPSFNPDIQEPFEVTIRVAFNVQVWIAWKLMYFSVSSCCAACLSRVLAEPTFVWLFLGSDCSRIIPLSV